MDVIEDDADANFEVPDVLLTAIVDGVVSERTRKVYVAESFNFLKWLKLNEPTSLTEYGLNKMIGYLEGEKNDVTERQLYTRCRADFDELLRGCDYAPIINIANLTPEIYINYCRQLRNKRTRQYLGRSTIGVKRAALFHLYRLHNGAGYSDAFNSTLNNLFRGLFRVLISRGAGQVVIDKNGKKEKVLPKWNQVSFFFLNFFLLFFLKFFFLRMKEKSL
jgi:hypothetical protein